MPHPICSYCGGHVQTHGDAETFWHVCPICQSAPSVNAGLNRAALKLDEEDWDRFRDDNTPPSSTVTLTLSREDFNAIRQAVFETAWKYPEESMQESRWLALEQRIWKQGGDARSSRRRP